MLRASVRVLSILVCAPAVLNRLLGMASDQPQGDRGDGRRRGPRVGVPHVPEDPPGRARPPVRGQWRLPGRPQRAVLERVGERGRDGSAARIRYCFPLRV